MRLALDRACASRPEISDRADETAIASTIAAAIATTTPIRTLDLIVIHTPKTVSLKKPVARWAAWKQVSRRDRTDSRAAEAVHSSFTQNVRRQKTVRRKHLYLAHRLMQTLPHEASGIFLIDCHPKDDRAPAKKRHLKHSRRRNCASVLESLLRSGVNHHEGHARIPNDQSRDRRCSRQAYAQPAGTAQRCRHYDVTRDGRSCTLVRQPSRTARRDRKRRRPCLLRRSRSQGFARGRRGALGQQLAVP